MGTRILKHRVPHEQVDRALRQLGLKPRVNAEEVPEDLVWQVWVTDDDDGRVDFVDDAFTQVSHVATSGEQEAQLEEELSRSLPLWVHDALLEHALLVLRDGSNEDRQRAAYAVGVEMNGNGPDSISASVLETYLTWHDRSARVAGARGFGMLPRPRFRVTAERLAKDSDPEIAELGQDLLERILELHGDTYVDEDIRPLMKAVASVVKANDRDRS